MKARRSIATLFVTAVLVLTGCSSPSDDSADDATSEPPAESSPAPSEAGGEDTDNTADSDQDDDAADDAAEENQDDGAGDDALLLTVGGEETLLQPTDVYCSGTEGQIRHIIGKTDDQLPIIEARGQEFAMVKVGQGEPYRTSQPGGVTYGDDSVTFDDTALHADAVLEGTMACTVWED